MLFPYVERSSAIKVRHFNFTNDSEYDKSRLPVLKADDHVIQPKTKKVPLKKRSSVVPDDIMEKAPSFLFKEGIMRQALECLIIFVKVRS